MFTLHPRLATDTIALGKLTLCEVLLMNNAHLPWVILVPRRDNIRELYELNQHDQEQIQHESILVSKLIMTAFAGDKLNTGTLGNIVPQLHLHHIVRYENDVCWPHPVWGNLPAKPYADNEKLRVCNSIVANLQRLSSDFEPV